MTLRRLSDVVLSLLLLFICLPALITFGLAVWLDQLAFPVARYERITREGRIVRLYRFRITSNTGFGPRRTAIGEILHRLHIDQIPQLLNVLNGDLPLFDDKPASGTVGSKRLVAVRER